MSEISQENWSPAPGSRTHAAAAADAAAMPDPAHVEARQAATAPAGEASPVAVDLVGSDGAIWSTRVLQAGQVSLLLPQDPRRRKAIIMAIDEPIVLCQTQELAQAAQNVLASVPYPAGFYLPNTGNNAIPLHSRGAVWAVNTSSSTATRISLLVERIENPDPVGYS